jgi:hypothetical protein
MKTGDCEWLIVRPMHAVLTMIMRRCYTDACEARHDPADSMTAAFQRTADDMLCLSVLPVNRLAVCEDPGLLQQLVGW